MTSTSDDPSESPIRAVAFDMDGTLVDTVPCHEEAYRVVFAEFGIKFDVSRTRGLSTRDAIQRAINESELESSFIENLVRLKQEKARKIILESTDLAFPGVVDVLVSLRQQIPIGLCTAGSATTVQLILATSLQQIHFDALVTGGDGFVAKPEPDMYVEISRRLGFSPSQVLAIEDSPSGIIAAQRAGCKVMQIAWNGEQKFSEMVPIIRGMNELKTVMLNL